MGAVPLSSVSYINLEPMAVNKYRIAGAAGGVAVVVVAAGVVAAGAAAAAAGVVAAALLGATVGLIGGVSFAATGGLPDLLRLMTRLIEAVNRFLMDFSSPMELVPTILDR